MTAQSGSISFNVSQVNCFLLYMLYVLC